MIFTFFLNCSKHKNQEATRTPLQKWWLMQRVTKPMAKRRVFLRFFFFFINVTLVTASPHFPCWYCCLIIFTVEAELFLVSPPQRPRRFLPSGASEADTINVRNPKTHQSPGVSHPAPLAPAVSQTEQKNKRPKRCFRPFADNQMAFLVFHFFFYEQADRYPSSTSLQRFYRLMFLLRCFLFNLCGGI